MTDEQCWEPCPTCDADGVIETTDVAVDGGLVQVVMEKCPNCGGTGDHPGWRAPTTRAKRGPDA